MTTSRSPLRAIKAQADKIAAVLKAAERRETVMADVGGKIAAARDRESVTFGVVMDDKLITIEMSWTTIRATSEAGISEYIIKHMRGARHRDTEH